MTLRAGLIGLGVMGRSHARVLTSLAGVELVGIADPAMADSATAGVAITANLEELLAFGMDYAVVATPTLLHEEVVAKLVQHGIHVLIEKPLSQSAASAERICTEVKKAGLVGAVGHIERYNAALQEARRRIEEGQLGRILQVSTRRQGPFPSRIADVGVVMDLCTHDVDLTSWITGERYTHISAYTARRAGRLHEDLVCVSAELGGGIIANHLVNWLSPFKERTVVVTGEEGAFVIDMLSADLTFYANGLPEMAWKEISHFRGVQLGDVTRYALARPEPLKSEHEAFRNALLGQDNDIVTLREGLEVVRTAERILEVSDRHVTDHASGSQR